MKSESSQPRGKRPIRAVVVDDQSDHRQMAEFMLLARGFDVVGNAADGREGVNLIRRLHPDVVVTDYQMPGWTGLDMIRNLRAIPGFERLPILVMTGSDDAGVNELRATPFVAVLPKPLNVSDLAETVDSLLVAADLARRSRRAVPSATA